MTVREGRDRQRTEDQAPVTLPLSFRSADLDETRSVIAKTFYDTSIDRLAPGDPFAARIDVVRLGPVTIGAFSFGTDVRVHSGVLGAYHVDVPLTGHMAWHQGARAAGTASAARAAVFGPSGDTSIDRWHGDCRALSVKIDAAALERHLEHLLGRTVRKPVLPTSELDVSRGPALGWARLVRSTARDMHETRHLLQQPLVAAPLQEALLNGLLLAADHPYRDELREPSSSLRPTPVKRVVDAIHERPEHPFNSVELAAIGQVSVRWLQEGFRRHVGMSPMAYLRDVRLTRVRDELRRAGPGEVSVGETAYRWGFVHLGRFASSYRARFGETPSETLHAP
ncbi:AraC family transcriptional regulator [Streptomyces sp. NPDC003077]|uniref:AraC family transcriptional regulator n=1 Tax=Streptomyces sp. NPDC003077 TaxID=3154443 RepID=UPI0033AEFEAF